MGIGCSGKGLSLLTFQGYFEAGASVGRYLAYRKWIKTIVMIFIMD